MPQFRDAPPGRLRWKFLQGVPDAGIVDCSGEIDDAGWFTTHAGAVAGPDDLRAKVEDGVLFARLGGVSLRATGSFDGIGDDDNSAYSGKFWVNLPLNRGVCATVAAIEMD